MLIRYKQRTQIFQKCYKSDMYLYCLRYPDELKHQISTCCARRKKLEKQKKLVHALAENVLLPCYSAWQSFLRVIEVLLF